MIFRRQQELQQELKMVFEKYKDLPRGQLEGALSYIIDECKTTYLFKTPPALENRTGHIRRSECRDFHDTHGPLR